MQSHVILSQTPVLGHIKLLRASPQTVMICQIQFTSYTQNLLFLDINGKLKYHDLQDFLNNEVTEVMNVAFKIIVRFIYCFCVFYYLFHTRTKLETTYQFFLACFQNTLFSLPL